jgi:hypothetical protein
MAYYNIGELVAELIREINTRPITEPAPGQYVDQCGYSKTGWAIREADGSCTCMPARAP